MQRPCRWQTISLGAVLARSTVELGLQGVGAQWLRSGLRLKDRGKES